MLTRLMVRADQLSALQNQIFALVDEFSRGTIDRLTDMCDTDLAAADLSGALKRAADLPTRREPSEPMSVYEPDSRNCVPGLARRSR